MLAKAPDKPARQCCELLVMTEDIVHMVKTSLNMPIHYTLIITKEKGTFLHFYSAL
jgi:hypothetical protein